MTTGTEGPTQPEPARPGLTSHAFDGVPVPDFADVQVVALRGATGIPADVWVHAIFDRRSVPVWVRALFVLRAAVVPLLGLRQSRERAAEPFRVREVLDGEAVGLQEPGQARGTRFEGFAHAHRSPRGGRRTCHGPVPDPCRGL